MLFKKEHKDMILNGTKTATRRAWKRPMVKVGNIYQAKLKMLSKEYFAKIKVIKLYKQRLRKMGLKDAKREGYPSLKEFFNVWYRINGLVNFSQEVYVIEFEVVEDSQNKTSTEDGENV